MVQTLKYGGNIITHIREQQIQQFHSLPDSFFLFLLRFVRVQATQQFIHATLEVTAHITLCTH